MDNLNTKLPLIQIIGALAGDKGSNTKDNLSIIFPVVTHITVRLQTAHGSSDVFCFQLLWEKGKRKKKKR